MAEPCVLDSGCWVWFITGRTLGCVQAFVMGHLSGASSTYDTIFRASSPRIQPKEVCALTFPRNYCRSLFSVEIKKRPCPGIRYPYFEHGKYTCGGIDMVDVIDVIVTKYDTTLDHSDQLFNEKHGTPFSEYTKSCRVVA